MSKIVKRASGTYQLINCPLCNDTKLHGAIKLGTKSYVCWRCGKHPLHKIQSFLHQDERDVSIPSKETIEFIPFELPANAQKIQPVHKKYLKKRRFNPDYIEKKYGILGTDLFTEPKYKMRIVIPIYFKGKIVSYQTRSIANREPRYLTCPKNKEILFHKDILYNWDNCTYDFCLVVEGIFDVWRFGDGAVAIFGTQFSENQIKLLKKLRKIYVLFDSEEKAQEQAHKLYHRLRSLNVNVQNLRINGKGDLAEQTNDFAKEFKEKLIKGGI